MNIPVNTVISQIQDIHNYMPAYFAIIIFFKAHGMCHTRRKIKRKEQFTETFFSVFNEMSPILVRCILGNEW